MTRNVPSFASTAIGHLLLVAGSWLAASLALAEDFPKFEYHEIARIGNHMGQTSLVDVDKDGKLDWVVGLQPRRRLVVPVPGPRPLDSPQDRRRCGHRGRRHGLRRGRRRLGGPGLRQHLVPQPGPSGREGVDQVFQRRDQQLPRRGRGRHRRRRQAGSGDDAGHQGAVLVQDPQRSDQALGEPLHRPGRPRRDRPARRRRHRRRRESGHRALDGLV